MLCGLNERICRTGCFFAQGFMFRHWTVFTYTARQNWPCLYVRISRLSMHSGSKNHTHHGVWNWGLPRGNTGTLCGFGHPLQIIKACKHKYVHVYVHVYVRMYVCMYVCMYACMYLRMYVCMHACMYVNVSMCVPTCVCMCACKNVSK